MEKVIITIILAIVAIAALVWACSLKVSGLAWFPGFFVAVCCGIGIMDVNNVDKEDKQNTGR